MINQLLVVGRLVSDPELKETEDGKKISNITLAVPRSYKNSNGDYDTDFIECNLYSNVAETTCEYCQKGDLVGVRGSVRTRNIERDGKSLNKNFYEVTRVTFLSGAKKTDTLEMED